MENQTRLLKKTPQELRDEFSKLTTKSDVAKMLEIAEGQLQYLVIWHKDKNYDSFNVPKKSGGVRKISSPSKALKFLQRKLNEVLQAVYTGPKVPQAAHGFIQEKSIVTNARQHLNRRQVLNIDLKDFFPSIHFGRVRGLFIAKPYALPENVATVLAQICCTTDGLLPQGAPTSPIISNMICAKLDRNLQKLATETKCFYTRYADDITFSTTTDLLERLVKKDSTSETGYTVSARLNKIIKDNGFVVNPQKVRLRTPNQRQEVTGLTVNNDEVNVNRQFFRQIRGMLHAYQKFGLKGASDKFARLDKTFLPPKSTQTIREKHFLNVLMGRLEFIRHIKGANNRSFQTLIKQLQLCNSDLARRFQVEPVTNKKDGNLHAIVVGVSTYLNKKEYRQLKACDKDADRVAEILVKNGYLPQHVQLLKSSTGGGKLSNRSGIVDALNEACKSTKPEDTLLFFYSGHGDTDENDSYLVTKSGDSEDLRNTALSLTQLKELLCAVPASTKVMILDACYSGPRIERGMKQEFYNDVLTEPENIVAISSCKVHEESFVINSEESVFARYLCEALSGRADKTPNGHITVNTVFSYTQKEVQKWAELERKSQTPVMTAKVTKDIIISVIPEPAHST